MTAKFLMKISKKKKNRNDSVLVKRSEQSIQYAMNQIQSSNISPYVKRLILYGSCARKTQSYHSDVDLLLELDANVDTEKYHNDIMQLRGCVSPKNLDDPEVDLKIVIGKGWEQQKMLYFDNIKREGVELWAQE